jgi:TPR repeat protein
MLRGRGLLAGHYHALREFLAAFATSSLMAWNAYAQDASPPRPPSSEANSCDYLAEAFAVPRFDTTAENLYQSGKITYIEYGYTLELIGEWTNYTSFLMLSSSVENCLHKFSKTIQDYLASSPIDLNAKRRLAVLKFWIGISQRSEASVRSRQSDPTEKQKRLIERLIEISILSLQQSSQLGEPYASLELAKIYELGWLDVIERNDEMAIGYYMSAGLGFARESHVRGAVFAAQQLYRLNPGSEIPDLIMSTLASTDGVIAPREARIDDGLPLVRGVHETTGRQVLIEERPIGLIVTFFLQFIYFDLRHKSLNDDDRKAIQAQDDAEDLNLNSAYRIGLVYKNSYIISTVVDPDFVLGEGYGQKLKYRMTWIEYNPVGKIYTGFGYFSGNITTTAGEGNEDMSVSFQDIVFTITNYWELGILGYSELEEKRKEAERLPYREIRPLRIEAGLTTPVTSNSILGPSIFVGFGLRY